MTVAMTDAAGLSTDQAPPLSIPASFFLLAPLAFVALGVLLVVEGNAPFVYRWTPITLAATHLGTLALLGSVMLGALYQMIPVVAGSKVPVVRLAHGVHAFWVIGVSALVVGLLGHAPQVVATGGIALALALTLFLVPVGIALTRSPVRSDTVWGMRMSVASLLALLLLGGAMVYAHATGNYPATRVARADTHAVLGFVCWVGGLISAVSWQVVPMFYLTDSHPRVVTRSTLAAVAVSALGVLLCLAVNASGMWRVVAAAPGALAVWVVHPLVTLRLIAGRRRRRADVSLLFWKAGLTCALAVFVLAVASVVLAAPRWQMLFGWLCLWGWGGLIMHGMLTRIVPFLVWFHRFAPQVGIVPVPTMRMLLPDRRAKLGLLLHGAALVAGVATIVTGLPMAGRVTGVLLIATGLVLGVNLVRALAYRVPATK